MDLPVRKPSSLLSSWLWHFWKWLIRLITGKCELHRLALWSGPVSQKTISIEQSLTQSHNKLLRELVTKAHLDVMEAMEQIITTKQIASSDQEQFRECVHPCLLRIQSIPSLLADVESLRGQSYSNENADHESMLMELWSRLNPHTPLKERISKQWQDIGFQGNDPATDFRGMGMLGPACLHYFSTHHGDVGRLVLSHSQHPQHGYPYAIVGINLTSLLYGWLKTGVLNRYMYTTCEEWPVDRALFMELVSYLLVTFDMYWMEQKPENVMVFPQVRKQFASQLKDKLEVATVSLKI